ncbi:MAG: hypothetical protein K2L82_01415 [Lachnospiraceae bacterium]|nr:hypothetical protein [Lachnospiraceae bacterium]
MEKSGKIILSKYEVSVLIISALTLLPTLGVLAFQAFRDFMAGETNNFRIYFVTGVVFLAFLLFSMLLCMRYAKEIVVPRVVLYGAFALLFVVHLLFLVKCYLNSPTVYPVLSGEWFPWHGKTDWKVFCLMLGVSAFGVAAFLWTGKQPKVVEVLRYPAYLLASAIAGFSMYAPNWAANDRMHGSAYYVSVYNALMNEPYTYSNQSIYGHYAILLKYPVKWLGGDYRAFNIVIAIVGGLSLFFVALALDLCIKNHFISIIAVWAVPVMFLYYPRNHWQMFPHRVLFAGIELYLITVLFYKKKAALKFVGYAVCCLSLLWNVETGIVCLGVWAATCIIYEELYVRTEWSWRHLGGSSIRNAMYSVFTIVGLIGIFNVYNMPLGEPFHGLRFLLYPMASWDMPEKIVVQAAEQAVQAAGAAASAGGGTASWGGGFVTGLSILFPVQISYWYLVFLLMGLAVVLYVVRQIFHRAEVNDYIMGITAVLALGHLTYFINRPCFDYLSIAFFEAVIIMAVIADRQWNRTSGLAYGERSVQFLFVAILSVLSVLTLWQTYFRISGRVEDGYYDTEEFHAITEEIAKVVPKDTYAVGMGIQEIYAELGWDTQSHVTDFTSIDCTGGDSLATFVVETAQQKECVICYRSKKTEERKTAYDYMRNYGFADEAVTIKNFWDLDIDEDWYWNIYYLEVDTSIENNQVEHYGALIR